MILLHHHYASMEFILPAALTLLLVMIWAASMAALHKAPYSLRSKLLLGLLFVFLPPAGIVWLGREVYTKYIQSEEQAHEPRSF